MPSLPTAEWNAALDSMTAAVNATLLEFDRRESQWAALAEAPAAAALPAQLLAELERRQAEWDARLFAAAEVAATMEKELDAREAAFSAWREIYGRWEDLIKRQDSFASPG
jgi:hypothetical protein